MYRNLKRRFHCDSFPYIAHKLNLHGTHVEYLGEQQFQKVTSKRITQKMQFIHNHSTDHVKGAVFQ
jgi:hypothetical protein